MAAGLIIAAIGAIIQGAEAYVVVGLILAEVALMKINDLFKPKVHANGPPPQNVTVQSSAEYRRLVLGQVRCGGVVLFYSTSGSTNQYLWYVVAYAGHQCHAVENAFLGAPPG